MTRDPQEQLGPRVLRAPLGRTVLKATLDLLGFQEILDPPERQE